MVCGISAIVFFSGMPSEAAGPVGEGEALGETLGEGDALGERLGDGEAVGDTVLATVSVGDTDAEDDSVADTEPVVDTDAEDDAVVEGVGGEVGVWLGKGSAECMAAGQFYGPARLSSPKTFIALL